MRAHPLAEAREISSLMLPELRKVIPAFLQRVDREERGVRWSAYLRGRETEIRALAASTTGGGDDGAREEVTLTDFDPDGEIKVVAAALYPASHLPHDRLLAMARAMTTAERIRVLKIYVGERENRRQRPGRAFEHASYSFDILSDYGAFRDLQRHRMLTLDWQDLTPRHGPTASRGDRGCRGARRLDSCDGRVRRAACASRSGPIADRRAIRCLDGVSDPVLHADERAPRRCTSSSYAPRHRAIRRIAGSVRRCTG